MSRPNTCDCLPKIGDTDKTRWGHCIQCPHRAFAHSSRRHQPFAGVLATEGGAWSRVLAWLPARQRQVLDLVNLQDFTPAEAADMLGLDGGTVRAHLHRANPAVEDHRALSGIWKGEKASDLSQELQDQLLEAAPSELRGEGESAVAQHVRSCPRCRQLAERIVAEERRLQSALAALEPRQPVDDAVRTAVGRRGSAGDGDRVLAAGLAAAAIATLALWHSGRSALPPSPPPTAMAQPFINQCGPNVIEGRPC